MSHAIKLSEEMFYSAERYARIENRSISKQIEYWSRIGKIASENPDLNYTTIKEILLSLEEAKSNDLSTYKFD
ncbi:MAG: hypothetical protein HRU36_05415 [Rickettsiales bacterium]|nr:hypothetical protein [Rickettsiales bacterium]